MAGSAGLKVDGEISRKLPLILIELKEVRSDE